MSGPDEADRGQGLSGAMVAAQAGGKAAGAEAGRAGCRQRPTFRPRRLPKPKREPEFDLSSLPKLEELTGSTDITAFLRKGVPEHLRNAALRKSWALDPAIRNYVNPALEYAYDWNTPGGVPGGGELGAGIDVARLVSQIMGEPAGRNRQIRPQVPEMRQQVPSGAATERDLPAKPQPELLSRFERVRYAAGKQKQRFKCRRRCRSRPKRQSEVAILLRRSSRCDAMAPQNRLFRQKFLRT